MKKTLFLLLTVFLLSLSSPVSAQYYDYDHDRGHHHDWSARAYHHGWYRTDYAPVPFRWHERRAFFPPGHMARVYDQDWVDRFPGLHAYRWENRYSDAFWYRGRRITDAVLFYNDDDELVSVGFMHNGSFIFLRDDRNGYESHDSFFFSWWSR
ncbi:Hypothetical protein LUCI_0636 [Lucifera butyrica]|uniref:Uncharacterized protein n=1 Tax=Lucifera butyrica TaxID=1351585 RepID=A0A498R3K1_9FIRM|nr:hypothetical protein [Lucifera butyrica]VBB05427.1 Hypothetical protein LUCI_0636 [Lucifera butyrica]